jgi:hypothetical protein
MQWPQDTMLSRFCQFLSTLNCLLSFNRQLFGVECHDRLLL